MSTKRRLSPSPVDQQTTTIDQSPTANVCLVCGDQARFINYGALSCQSCKTFFRRNGFRPEIVRPCAINQTCEINMLTRHTCTFCRLQKCYTIGMSSLLIRKEDIKKAKKSKSDSNELITTNQEITSTITNRSILNDSEWTLISNVVSAYETHNSVSQICKQIDTLLEISNDLQLNTIDSYEVICQMFTSIRSYLSSSPDFQILDVKEQISLFKRNLQTMIAFYLVLFFRETNLIQNTQLIESFSKFYSFEMFQLIKSFNEQIDLDATTLKLILFVFAFSTNCSFINHLDDNERDSLIHGTFRIMTSQNLYLEVLWKYMIYRYGYSQSIRRVSRIVQIFVCLSKHVSSISMNNSIYQNLIANIIENIQKSLTHNEH